MNKQKSTKTKFSLQRALRDRRLLGGLVIVLFGTIGFFVLFLGMAATPVTNAPPAPAIYFSPTGQSLAVNTTFTVQLKVNSGTTAVNAVQANFTYPTNSLTWVSTSYTGSAFANEAQNLVNATTGQVNIARATTGATSVSGDQLVATLTFTTKAVGGAANLTFGTGTALASASTNANILPGTAAYGNASYIIDTTGPVVSVTAPAANIQFGSSYTINVTATDAASDVTKVEIYIDGVLKATDTTSPYSYVWATGAVAEGAHTFSAKAFDTYSNSTTSATINATVVDSIAPTVSVTTPVAGAKLAGTVSVTATAADNTGGKGLAKVELYIDNVLKGTLTASPFTFSIDTKTLTDATHSLVAKAYDKAVTPNIGTSAAVAVSVDNSDTIPPTTPANLRTTGKTLNSIAVAWDASTDNVGVAGYRLSRNGAVVYNGTQLAYNDATLVEGAAYTYSVVALDAKGNVSAANTLSESTLARKTGDVNGDNQVNISDLSLLISKWDTNDSASDINKDGVVNIFDLSRLISNWGL